MSPVGPIVPKGPWAQWAPRVSWALDVRVGSKSESRPDTSRPTGHPKSVVSDSWISCWAHGAHLFQPWEEIKTWAQILDQGQIGAWCSRCKKAVAQMAKGGLQTPLDRVPQNHAHTCMSRSALLLS
jgi:hypothetical protein